MINQQFKNKLEECEAVVKICNSYWIKYKGDLHDKADFWDDTLHSLDNEFWHNAVSVMRVFAEVCPEHLLSGTQTIFRDVEAVLLKQGHQERCLDKRAHKKLEFKALMHLKDVINSIGGYEAPTRFEPEIELTQFEQLFKGETNG